jgi:hypothetical protein
MSVGNKLFLLFLAMLIPIAAFAQDPPANCHNRDFAHPLSSNVCDADYHDWLKDQHFTPFYKDKQWWAGEAVIMTSVSLDTASTSFARNNGNIEKNPLLGPHPSDAKLAAFSIAGVATYTVLNIAARHFGQKDPNKYWRFAGRWSIPLITAGIHVPLAIHNYNLPRWDPYAP